MEVKIAINIPDLHIPWHDVAYCEVLLKVMTHINENYGLDEINFLGDVADFYNFKLWPKAPREMPIRLYAKHEIFLVNNFFDEIDSKFKESKKRFMCGNHEDRLLRYILKKAPELFDAHLIEDYFKFYQRGYDYHPFGRNQRARVLDTNLFIRHRPYSSGVNCAMSSIQQKHINISFGDTHRLQMTKIKDGDENEIAAYSIGWGGDPRGDVYHYMDTDNWTQGFQIVFQVGEGEHDWCQVLIEVKEIDGKKICFFDGCFFESEIKPIQTPEYMFAWNGISNEDN